MDIFLPYSSGWIIYLYVHCYDFVEHTVPQNRLWQQLVILPGLPFKYVYNYTAKCYLIIDVRAVCREHSPLGYHIQTFFMVFSVLK